MEKVGAGLGMTLADVVNGAVGPSDRCCMGYLNPAADGGAATSAELWQPTGVAVDTAGNIYIADFGNNRIRKVAASTGLISTVAGNGSEGYSGDGGAATSAELWYPLKVAVDTAGNIYIADDLNNRIRKVTASTGIISTVAGNGTGGYSGDGGVATSAELDMPHGVTLDTAGNIYIADEDNNRIRKVTASTGIISTVAGNGTAGYSGDGGAATSAELWLPVGVAVDTAGNIYIADHQRIRKVTVSTGIISTVAGNGAAGYSGDGGAATSAELNGPEGVAVDTADNIYIGDTSNNRVRAVGTSAELSNFDDITTGWQLCEGSCAGGNNPTQVTQTFGISPPSIDGTSMKLLLSGPSGANNGWYYNTGAKDTATSFTLDMEFNVPSTTYVQALEFDQFQYLHAGDGGVTANTRLYFGTECVSGSTWKVWDSSGVGWVSVSGATCSYNVSSTAFNHLTIAGHRVTGDTSCTGGYPCMYYDSITLNGKVVVSNVKTNAGALPSGWGEQTGFMIQLDTNSTCGSACTIQEYIDKGNISIY